MRPGRKTRPGSPSGTGSWASSDSSRSAINRAALSSERLLMPSVRTPASAQAAADSLLSVEEMDERIDELSNLRDDIGKYRDHIASRIEEGQ